MEIYPHPRNITLFKKSGFDANTLWCHRLPSTLSSPKRQLSGYNVFVLISTFIFLPTYWDGLWLQSERAFAVFHQEINAGFAESAENTGVLVSSLPHGEVGRHGPFTQIYLRHTKASCLILFRQEKVLFVFTCTSEKPAVRTLIFEPW